MISYFQIDETQYRRPDAMWKRMVNARSYLTTNVDGLNDSVKDGYYTGDELNSLVASGDILLRESVKIARFIDENIYRLQRGVDGFVWDYPLARVPTKMVVISLERIRDGNQAFLPKHTS